VRAVFVVEDDGRLVGVMTRKTLVREVVAAGKELGVSAAQVALAWLRYRLVAVIPIIGARKLAQIEDYIRKPGREPFLGTTSAVG